jgi:hypothetical protein
MQAFYPEVLHKLLVFPTGFFTKAVWAVVKVFLAKVTREKVLMLEGGRRPPMLVKFIDPSNIPPQFQVAKATR